MIRYQQIIHARALLNHRNFRKASDTENISQPAFSRSIANLENYLGVTLFNRQRGNITPTPYGELLGKHVDRILDAANELEREVNILKELGGGELSVAMAPYPGELSGHSAIGKLVSEYPEIRCKVTAVDWFEVERVVVDRKVDVGFSELSEARTNTKLVTELIGQHRFVFFCRTGHPLLELSHIKKEDFLNYPLVLIKLPVRIAPYFPGKLFPEKNTTNMLPSIEIQDLYQSRKIVCESNAFSAATPAQIFQDLEAGKLKIIPFYESWMILNYGFIYEKGRMLSPAASKYMDIVKDVEHEVSTQNKILLKKYL